MMENKKLHAIKFLYGLDKLDKNISKISVCTLM